MMWYMTLSGGRVILVGALVMYSVCTIVLLFVGLLWIPGAGWCALELPRWVGLGVHAALRYAPA